MKESAKPRFEWGQRVQSAVDLFNDGTFPEQAADALLVKEGEEGEIVQVGQYVDSSTVVYLVEFTSNRVVGCTEPELKILQSNKEAR